MADLISTICDASIPSAAISAFLSEVVTEAFDA
jgi:hypothetical protein